MRCKLRAVVSFIMLLAALCSLPQRACGVGQIEHVFIPAETYPDTLRNLHLKTMIVQEATPKAVIVINRDDPLHVLLAAEINASLRALPGLAQVSLAIIDDEAFLAATNFSKPLILIGNYATNRVIKRYVYEKKLQQVDSNRPGPDNWVINNIRIGQEISGGYQSANAIVIASESATKLREAVDFFRNTMLPAGYQANSVIFDESVVGRQSTRWSMTPDAAAPRSATPRQATSHGLGGAIGHGNRYWLTGDRDEAELFTAALNNYGSIAQNQQWFGGRSEEQGFNSQVGDNSGALDFLIKDLIPVWTKIQRSPYFSDPSLARHPGTGMDQRLYIDKLINWMVREYYKCPTVRGLIDPGTGEPPVRGAIGYAERDTFPLGNHELRAALGMFLAGQYFTRDGHTYDASNARDYFFDVTYPDDHAAQWLLDGDTAFAPYLQLSWSNDDAGGYYDTDTGFTRDYLRFKDSAALSEAYYGSTGGSLGIGMDRSVADTFCLVTPNSLMKPGFGDTHEIGPPEYETFDLRFWREQYLDGRYSWMCDDLYHVRTSKWEKTFLQYGLANLRELGVQPREPVDLLGIKVIPLQRNLFNVVNNSGGRSTYDTSLYGEPYKEAHIAPGEAVNKVVFRSGWGHGFDQGRDQYLGIDGVSYLGHGHEDALGIFGFEDNDAMFIIDNTYYSGERGYQNAVTVSKTDELLTQQEAKSNSSTVARVNALADFSRTGFIALELPQYGNFVAWSAQPVAGEWSVDLRRNVFWQKEGVFVILDQIKANNPGAYELSLRWKPNNTPAYSSTLAGDAIHIVKTAAGQHCMVKTRQGDYATDPKYGNARTVSSYSLPMGATAGVPTLIYTYRSGEDPNYQVATVDGGAVYQVTSPVTHDDIYLGTSDKTARQGWKDFQVEAGLFWIEPKGMEVPQYFALVNGRHLAQTKPTRLLFSSDLPASVECRLSVDPPSGGMIVTGPGVTTVQGIYLPAGSSLVVDGQVKTIPFTLTEGTHQFSYDHAGDE